MVAGRDGTGWAIADRLGDRGPAGRSRIDSTAGTSQIGEPAGSRF